RHIKEEEDQAVMQAYHAADPEPLSRLLAIGKAFIAWSMSHPRESSFCYLRVQQEALMRGKPAYIGEHSFASDLVLLELIREMRRDYPVRQIADEALLTMIVGMISRATIDQAAFGTTNQETMVQQINEICFGMLFYEPVSIPE